MPNAQTNQVLAIGLTGSFGSGCGYTAEHVFSKQGFQVVSLSTFLKDEYQTSKGKPAKDATRRELQEFGDHLRNTKGEGYLAELACQKIDVERKKNGCTHWVIDSIRNPKEIYHLQSHFHKFFLFGIFAKKDIRWLRVKDIYHGNQLQFDEDDARDTGDHSPQYGQRVADCFAEADIVIPNEGNIEQVENEDFMKYAGRVSIYIELVKAPLKHQQPIRQQEAIMAAAYAISQQSSCLKRKVGAVIVDATGNIIASGFNEVPSHSRPCGGTYNQCYRERAWDEFFPQLTQLIPQARDNQEAIRILFRGKFKILDFCHSLHAEENAIVNLARNGRSVPMDQCRLYTTTYPCRLCANKIVNLGIKHVVYLEPYPDEQAKIILEKAGVKDEFFEGVTFHAYFRLYGDTK